MPKVQNYVKKLFPLKEMLLVISGVSSLYLLMGKVGDKCNGHYCSFSFNLLKTLSDRYTSSSDNMAEAAVLDCADTCNRCQQSLCVEQMGTVGQKLEEELWGNRVNCACAVILPPAVIEIGPVRSLRVGRQ